MKNRVIIACFLSSLFLILPILSYGQFITTRVIDNTINTSQEGFYYSLPLTVLKIDLVYEKVKQQPGPLADYAENYLGTTEYIKSNSKIHKLLNVSIEPVYEPDPNQIYYVQFPLEKSKDEKGTAFYLSELGSLHSYNHVVDERESIKEVTDKTLIFMQGEDDFKHYADYHRKKKTDTIVRKITIDTVSIERFIYKTSWVDKNNEDKANEAALQISKIREARFNLLTGYQEVNYGESIKYMDKQLLDLEQQYLELFLGKESKDYVNQTVYYTPQKDINNGTLLNFNGVDDVNIKIIPSGSVGALPENPPSKINFLYYRVPEFVTIEISQNGEILHREKLLVNQLGVTASAPLDEVKMQFNPETGSLIKIMRE